MSEPNEEKNIDSSEKPKSSERFGYFSFLIVGLLIFIVMFGLVLPRLMFSPQQQASTEKIAEPLPPAKDNEQALPQNTTVTAEQQPAPPQVADTAQTPDNNDQRVSELEEKLKSLQEEHEKTVAELTSKFNEQNSSIKNKANAIVATVVMFEELKDKIKNGKPYETELSQLRKTTASKDSINDILNFLEDGAKSGVLTQAQLKAKFPALIREAIISKADGFLQKTIYKFIIIRKTGEQSGDDDEAVMARTESRLNDNDLRGAIKELDTLSTDNQEIFKEWANSAKKYLDTQEKLDLLQVQLTQTDPAS